MPLSFLWLEITGRCQLTCTHCYAGSSPTGTHGTMTGHDWRHVIDQAAELGVRMVQFIGGEPTLHPELPLLVDHALGHRIDVEIFTNLVRVTPPLWETFSKPGVRLATSYYTDNPDQHEAITQRRGSHARTTANIAEVVRRSIPLRVGLVDVTDGQRVDQARDLLLGLGVTEIGADHLRQVGRGVRTLEPDVSQLCGHCADGRVAISPTGEVWPCVFARWLPVGNVRTATLADILVAPATGRLRAELGAEFARRDLVAPGTPAPPGPVPGWPVPSMPCVPRMCDPQCGPSCSPACQPVGNCRPSGGCAPDYR